jgi:hypothetical protein
MSATATVELPAIDKLTDEQKERLLALLIKDQMDRRPPRMPIFVRLDGEELGLFKPKYKPLEKTTPYPFTAEELKEIERRIANPGKTFTREEIRALEASGDDAWMRQ